jgi:ribosomal protein S18 acetylase RimI-like enzyme
MPVLVRPALLEDLSVIGKLGAELVRLHHAFDQVRFLIADSLEIGYERFLRSELRHNPDAVVMAAAVDGRIVGYTYASLEPQDWRTLLNAHGAIHDLFVDPTARRIGVGRALMVATIDALASRGARQFVLSTAVRNTTAQKLFESLGFRPTMLEMTLDAKAS